MIEASFESLVSNVISALRVSQSAPFPLESAFTAVSQRRAEREVVLSALVQKETPLQAIFDILSVFDVVAATCATALARKGDGAIADTAYGAEVTDLWCRATAGRALWFERFVRWPQENSVKKVEALESTAKEVAGMALSLAVRLGTQPAQFTAFVADISGRKGG
jgi:hypothetical protein